MMQMVSTKHLEKLWDKTRKDNLRMRVYLYSTSTGMDAIFVLAVHTKNQTASLIEVKTKNLDSAAARILDEYKRIKP